MKHDNGLLALVGSDVTLINCMLHARTQKNTHANTSIRRHKHHIMNASAGCMQSPTHRGLYLTLTFHESDKTNIANTIMFGFKITES